VEVVVWFPRVFAYVEAFPFDKVFHTVVSEVTVQYGVYIKLFDTVNKCQRGQRSDFSFGNGVCVSFTIRNTG
jgi:hypothetical protein